MKPLTFQAFAANAVAWVGPLVPASGWSDLHHLAVSAGAIRPRGWGNLPHHQRGGQVGGRAFLIACPIQTPAATLGLDAQAKREERSALHHKLLESGFEDASSAYWADAVWIAVWHFHDVRSPMGHIVYSEEVVAPLKWKKIVLYDVETKEPLVL